MAINRIVDQAMLNSSAKSAGSCCSAKAPVQKGGSSRRPLDAFAITLALGSCFIWALQQVAIKGTALEVDPLLQVVIRTVIALILLWAAQKFFIKEEWNSAVKWWHGMLVGLFYFGEFFCVSQALRLGPSSHVAVLLYTAPMFSAVGLAFAIAEERMSLIQWTGVFTAFGGVAFSILYPALVDGAGSPTDPEWLLGDFFGIMAGLSWGLTTVIIRVTPMSNAAPTQMLFWQLLGGLVFFTIMLFATGQTHFEPKFWGWTNLVFQGVVVSFASYLTWCWLLRNYLASRLGVLCFLTPIYGILLSVLILGERLHAAFLLGASLVFVGLICVQASQIKSWWKHRRAVREKRAGYPDLKDIERHLDK